MRKILQSTTHSIKYYILDKIILRHIVNVVNNKYAKKRGLLILFYNLNLQIIKINGFNKIVRCKSGFIMSFEFCDRRIQPDWFTQVELIADFFYRVKDFMSSGICRSVTNDSIA